MTPPWASGEDPNLKKVMIRFRVFLLHGDVISFKGHIPLSDLRLTWSLPDTQVPEDLSGGGGSSQGFASAWEALLQLPAVRRLTVLQVVDDPRDGLLPCGSHRTLFKEREKKTRALRTVRTVSWGEI